MVVEIGVPLNGDRLDYHAAMPMIKTVLRHEMEHSQQRDEAPFTRDVQFGWPEINHKVSGGDFGDIDSMRDYLGHPSEIEAWVSGLYKYAKTAKIPFVQAMDMQLKRLSNSMIEAGAKLMDVQSMLSDIRSRWMAYQRHRFPMAQV